MSNYIKPEINIISELNEGVYTNSGIPLFGNGCKSIYMKGVFQMPTYNPIEDGYKKGRGCEGCPAWNGTSCRFLSAPDQISNWDDDFRPTWEVNGHKPEEKGY